MELRNVCLGSAGHNFFFDEDQVDTFIKEETEHDIDGLTFQEKVELINDALSLGKSRAKFFSVTEMLTGKKYMAFYVL